MKEFWLKIEFKVCKTSWRPCLPLVIPRCNETEEYRRIGNIPWTETLGRIKAEGHKRKKDIRACLSVFYPRVAASVCSVRVPCLRPSEAQSLYESGPSHVLQQCMPGSPGTRAQGRRLIVRAGYKYPRSGKRETRCGAECWGHVLTRSKSPSPQFLLPIIKLYDEPFCFSSFPTQCAQRSRKSPEKIERDVVWVRRKKETSRENSFFAILFTNLIREESVGLSDKLPCDDLVNGRVKNMKLTRLGSQMKKFEREIRENKVEKNEKFIHF